MEFLEIKNAKYLDEAGALIDLTLVTSAGEIPFTYSASDDEAASLFVRERMGTFPISSYTPPPPTPFSELKAAKKAEIAQARYNAEIAGVTVNGISIKTDRESQGLITGAALKAMQDSTYTCRWKGVNGFVELTAPQIIAVADAVRQHVQSCFDHEAELLPLIEAATTKEQLDIIVWE
jgi:hypothetical protein